MLKRTLICWPICWSMTILTSALDTVSPFCVVIRSSKVCDAMICWTSRSHLIRRYEKEGPSATRHPPLNEFTQAIIAEK